MKMLPWQDSVIPSSHSRSCRSVPSSIGPRVLPVFLPVVEVVARQLLRLDDQQVLRVLLLGCTGLKLPVMTVCLSMIMILLWAIAWAASMYVGILLLARKVAPVYFVVLWLFQNDFHRHSRLWASTRALAIGADVNEQACTRISSAALSISLTTA